VAEGESFHAIYLVLNDFTLFPASLRSVYPHITGATVITSHDRDRYGRPVEPDGTVEAVLTRALDPDRKVNVIVCTEGSEAALRNRAMAFAHPPAPAGRIHDREQGLAVMPPPDWFWIVDADEIYDTDDVRRLKAFVREHPAPAYWAGSYSYWRSWNWRIAERSRRVVLLRPGRWFDHLRHPRLSFVARAVRKLRHLRLLPGRAETAFIGAQVPREVAVFHHGDWVGPRERIEAKLARSGHRDQFIDGWLERVWDQWTPEMRDLHPFEPEMFPLAAHVPTARLPAAIREHPWPDGWLEHD
jgi:hypothetical protein